MPNKDDTIARETVNLRRSCTVNCDTISKHHTRVERNRQDTYRMLYVLEWRTVSALMRRLFWCLFPELRSNEWNKRQYNTGVSAETARHESTYIILFLTRHRGSIDIDKNDDLNTSSPCLTRSVFVRLMTSWYHNRLLMTSQWQTIVTRSRE